MTQQTYQVNTQQLHSQPSNTDQATPQPTPPPQQAAPPPIINNVDDFLSDFTTHAKNSADTVVNEEGVREIKSNIEIAPDPATQMTPEQARKKVEQFMKLRDMLQSKGMAMAAGNPNLAQQFKMEPWEMDWYCEVYESVVMDLGYIPKWLEIVLAEAFIMTPKIMQVIAIRKEMNEAERLRQKSHENGTIQATSTPPKPQREDFKTRWTVDNDGYFTADSKGTYLKQADRKERPIMNQVNYDLLVKHNGQDLIDQLYKK